MHASRFEVLLALEVYNGRSTAVSSETFVMKWHVIFKPAGTTTLGGPNCNNIPNLQLPFMAESTPHMFPDIFGDQQETSSRSHCQESRSNNTHVPTSCEMEPWSPSPSGSSCSNTSLVNGDVAGLEKVLNSDVFLWDFSELGSIMS